MATEGLAAGLQNLTSGALAGFQVARKTQLENLALQRQAEQDRQARLNTIRDNFERGQAQRQAQVQNSIQARNNALAKLTRDAEIARKKKQAQVSALQQSNKNILNVLSSKTSPNAWTTLAAKIDANNEQISSLLDISTAGVPKFADVNFTTETVQEYKSLVKDHTASLKIIDKEIQTGIPGAKDRKKLENETFMAALQDLQLKNSANTADTINPQDLNTAITDTLQSVTSTDVGTAANIPPNVLTAAGLPDTLDLTFDQANRLSGILSTNKRGETSLTKTDKNITSKEKIAGMKDETKRIIAKDKNTIEQGKLIQNAVKITISLRKLQEQISQDNKSNQLKRDLFDLQAAKQEKTLEFKRKELDFRSRTLDLTEKKYDLSLGQIESRLQQGKASDARIIPVKLVDSKTKLDLIKKKTAQVMALFDPSFVGPIEGLFRGTFREFTGIGLTEKEQTFRALLFDIANSILYLKSGKQINQQEFKRIQAVLPTPKSPDKGFLAKMKNLQVELANYEERLNENLQIAGYKTFDAAAKAVKDAGINIDLYNALKKDLDLGSSIADLRAELEDANAIRRSNGKAEIDIDLYLGAGGVKVGQ